MMAILMRRTRLFSLLVVTTAVTIGPALAASAATRPHTGAHRTPPSARPARPAPSVTLQATPRKLVYGQRATFTGRVTPATGGQAVQILDGHGEVVARAT